MNDKTDTLAVYRAALERLKVNRPLVVPRGTKITNDSVSLEAGRKKGSIKKGRPAFVPLIGEIATAAIDISSATGYKPMTEHKKWKDRSDGYKKQFEAAMISIVARVYEIYELKKRIVDLEQKVASLSLQVANSPVSLKEVRTARYGKKTSSDPV